MPCMCVCVSIESEMRFQWSRRNRWNSYALFLSLGFVFFLVSSLHFHLNLTHYMHAFISHTVQNPAHNWINVNVLTFVQMHLLCFFLFFFLLFSFFCPWCRNWVVSGRWFLLFHLQAKHMEFDMNKIHCITLIRLSRLSISISMKSFRCIFNQFVAGNEHDPTKWNDSTQHTFNGRLIADRTRQQQSSKFTNYFDSMKGDWSESFCIAFIFRGLNSLFISIYNTNENALLLLLLLFLLYKWWKCVMILQCISELL